MKKDHPDHKFAWVELLLFSIAFDDKVLKTFMADLYKLKTVVQGKVTNYSSPRAFACDPRTAFNFLKARASTKTLSDLQKSYGDGTGKPMARKADQDSSAGVAGGVNQSPAIENNDGEEDEDYVRKGKDAADDSAFDPTSVEAEPPPGALKGANYWVSKYISLNFTVKILYVSKAAEELCNQEGWDYDNDKLYNKAVNKIVKQYKLEQTFQKEAFLLPLPMDFVNYVDKIAGEQGLFPTEYSDKFFRRLHGVGLKIRNLSAEVCYDLKIVSLSTWLVFH